MCLNSVQPVVWARLFGSRGLLVSVWMSTVRHGLKEDHIIPCSSACLTAEYSNTRELVSTYSQGGRHQAATNAPPQVLPTQHTKAQKITHSFLPSSRGTKEKSHQKEGIREWPNRRGPPLFAPFGAAMENVTPTAAPGPPRCEVTMETLRRQVIYGLAVRILWWRNIPWIYKD